MKELNEKSKKIYNIIIGAGILFVIGILCFGFGMNYGRKETVNIINDVTKDYEFYIYDKDNYGISYGKGVEIYNDEKYVLGYEYDRNTRKINLWYDHR